MMLSSLRAAPRPSARPSHHQTEDEDARTGSRRCSPALVSVALTAIALAGCSTPQGTFSQRYHCWDLAYSQTAPLPQLLIFGDPHSTAESYNACMTEPPIEKDPTP